MGKLEKYTSYKYSGVEWLGEIPEHWKILKSKYFHKNLKGLNTKRICNNVLSLTLRGVVNNNIDSPEGLVPKDYATYQIFEKEDLVFKLIDLENISTSRVGIVHEKGIMSSAYIRLKTGKSSIPRFAYYYYYSLYINQVYNNIGSGVRSTLGPNDLLNIEYIEPSINEQKQIVSFLDNKIAQIDNAISQKGQLIELLKEQKQITINEAVTKGLDKDVEFKDSGVKWIGEIPKHWEIVRSKRLFQQRKDRARKGDKQLTASQKYGVIYQDKFMELEGRRVTQVEYNHAILKRAEAGDFLISMRSFQGGIEYCRNTGSVSSAYVALIPIKHVVPEYFKYLFKSQKYITALSSTSNLVRDGQALRFENFSMVDLLVIPAKEQEEIAKYIDNQTAKINTAIELQQNYIAKLKEYKASLIDSVVTGKVRIS